MTRQGTYTEVDGDLIKLALDGKFDVIAHGCNCLSTMGAGIALQMKDTFHCDTFELELMGPNINKLGQIEFESFTDTGYGIRKSNPNDLYVGDILVTVVNAYTQFNYGRNHKDGDLKPIDYEALTLCVRKLNIVFAGKHIGLPKIGSGLAGGDWNLIKDIIKRELKDCQVTVVNYKPE